MISCEETIKERCNIYNSFKNIFYLKIVTQKAFLEKDIHQSLINFLYEIHWRETNIASSIIRWQSPNLEGEDEIGVRKLLNGLEFLIEGNKKWMKTYRFYKIFSVAFFHIIE
jgi:hypothetical protein